MNAIAFITYRGITTLIEGNKRFGLPGLVMINASNIQIQSDENIV